MRREWGESLHENEQSIAPDPFKALSWALLKGHPTRKQNEKEAAKAICASISINLKER